MLVRQILKPRAGERTVEASNSISAPFCPGMRKDWRLAMLDPVAVVELSLIRELCYTR